MKSKWDVVRKVDHGISDVISNVKKISSNFESKVNELIIPENNLVEKFYAVCLNMVKFDKEMIKKILVDKNQIQEIVISTSDSISYIPIWVCVRYIESLLESAPKRLEDGGEVSITLVYKKNKDFDKDEK